MKLRNSCRSPGGADLDPPCSLEVIQVQYLRAATQVHTSPLVFVPEGVKINKETYIETILEQTMKPWAKKTYGDKGWTFQQDGATSHTARVTRGAKTTAQASSPRTSGPHHPQI